jgi:hypothetical protein
MALAQLAGGGGGLGARQVEHGDTRALLRHQPGGGESQAIGAGTAGDDGDFVLEQHLDRLLWRVVFGSNTRDAACFHSPARPFLAFSRARLVGRSLSPEFVLRMVETRLPDGKRYFFNLR